MTYVMDATAMIAFLNGERGADLVGNCLLDPDSNSLAHAINCCEVYYGAYRESGEAAAEMAMEKIADVGIQMRDDFDPNFWKEAGKLKASHRISLADAFAIALTLRVGGTLITSDHHELDPIAAAGLCPITFFR
jgi:PIN domain nuclease of toxin-antitoxin system